MRKIGANLLFTMNGSPLRQGYLVLDDNENILDVVDTKGDLNEIHGLAFYSGILIPGLIVGYQPEIISQESIVNSKVSRILYQKGFQAVDLSQNYSRVQEILLSDHHSFEENLFENTLVAAKMNNLHGKVGSFEEGKCPGVIHIQGYDFTNHCLLPDAIVQRIV